MKSGANARDIVKIRTMAEEGYSAEDISSSMRIDINVIEKFIKGKSATKSKSATTKGKADGFGTETF